MLSTAIIRAQRLHDQFKLLFKLRVVRFPAGEVGGQAGLHLAQFAALPLVSEQVAVEVERDHYQRLFAALLHQLALFLEGGVEFVVHPPAREGVLGGAEHHFVPEFDAAIHLFVDVIAGQHLMFIEPTTDAPHLQLIV